MLQISPKYSDQEAKLKMNLRYKYLQHDSSKWSYQAKNRGSDCGFLFLFIFETDLLRKNGDGTILSPIRNKQSANGI